MYKLWRSAYKEYLLLKRDFGGLIILFVMPLVLVIAVTLIQETTYNQIFTSKISVLLLDNDSADLSQSIIAGLKQNSLFDIVEEINGKKLTEEQVNDLILKGKYKMAVVIPGSLTENLNLKVSQSVSKVLEELGLSDEDEVDNRKIEKQQIKLYFDPAIQMALKNGIKSSIDNMVTKIEMQSVYKAFSKELDIKGEAFEDSEFISFREINPQKNNVEIKPNTVQHNVPAWTLFAIFFIVVPLSVNIVNEKNQGTFVRLRTNPVSYSTVLGGKIIVYLFVCLIQFALMLLIGLYLFPYMGLPDLEINGSYYLLFLIAVFSGLSAIGLGILIGTVANTQQQSAPFGATMVVILAAFGGLWIPVFAMPGILRFIAGISPMNWGLDGFYDVIIRNSSFVQILPEISLLGFFFVLMLSISIAYDKVKNTL